MSIDRLPYLYFVSGEKEDRTTILLHIYPYKYFELHLFKNYEIHYTMNPIFSQRVCMIYFQN